MQILYKDTFIIRLQDQWRYLNERSPKAAQRFKTKIIDKIKGISRNPYHCRKSMCFDDDSIRDLVYDGYTVVFRVNGNQVEVFGLVRYQEYPTDE